MTGERKKAVKTVGLIIFATAGSKLLGLFRDIYTAALYGGGMENSALIVASDIPANFFEILFGAAVLGVFIPVYNSEDDNREDFANIFLNFIILATGFLALIVFIFAPYIVKAAAGGYDEKTIELTVDLLRIIFPSVVLTGSVFTFTGILQSKGEFLAPALVSAFSNIGIIIYLALFNGYFKIYGLGAAYLISWFIQLLTLVIPLAKKRYKYRFILDLKNPAFKKALKTALPIMAGSWLIPGSRMIINRFASMCGDYDSIVAALGKAWGLFLIITGILIHGICNYIFPSLAQNAGDDKKFLKIVKSGISASAFVIFPVAAIAYVLKNEAFAVLYMRGKFTPELAELSADMFAALAPAMVMYAAIEILNRVFYAKNMAKFSMAASLAGMAACFALCGVFTEKGITAAVLISQGLSAAVLIFALKMKIKEIFDKNFLKNIVKIVVSSGFLFLVIKIIYLIMGNDAFDSGPVKNILTAALIVITGLCAYTGINFILKTDEIKTVVKIIKRQG